MCSFSTACGASTPAQAAALVAIGAAASFCSGFSARVVGACVPNRATSWFDEEVVVVEALPRLGVGGGLLVGGAAALVDALRPPDDLSSCLARQVGTAAVAAVAGPLLGALVGGYRGSRGSQGPQPLQMVAALTMVSTLLPVAAVSVAVAAYGGIIAPYD